MIPCNYCGGRGRVPNNPYGREGRFRGPSEHVCEYCDGTGQLDDEPEARQLLPCRQYPTTDTPSGHLEN